MWFLDMVRQVFAPFRWRDDETERPGSEPPQAEVRDAGVVEDPEVRDADPVPRADGSTGPTAEDFAPAGPATAAGGSAPAADGSVPAEEPVRYRTVTVQRGDTLSSLAERHGTDWRRMAELNGISEPELVYPGQVFKLPPG